MGVVLLTAACILGLYGLFVILYGGESGGGDTYVELAGRRIDADLVGAGAMLLAVAGMLASLHVLRRR